MIAGALSALLLTAVLSGTASPSPPPDEGRLAGTAAGVGRPHPGRAMDPSEAAEEDNPEREAPSSPGPSRVPTPPPTRAPAPPAAARLDGAAGDRGTQQQPPPPRRVLRILPLGTGLALTGLGLGFFALRLRRR
ncbi:hypothetical protein [Streptomyces orinoci]|uniref:Uncharacterized protein n=1 Tax=Streptomyces orinoci TaxID=67339 RepID=A0ABV3K5W4_STRON|nr:hypothetical protein [Streptomyces orinoci]